MKLASRVGFTTSVVLFFTATSAKPAEAAFIGAYDPSKWTLLNVDADGFIETSDAPAQIRLYGGDTYSNNRGTTDYQTIAVANGVLSFTWNYLTEETGDGATYDPFSFVKNGINSNIFADPVTTGQGNYTTTVTAGDVFSFRITTLDNRLGRGSVAISNFNAPVPEPLTVGGSMVALGMGWWLKRQQAVS